MTRRTNRLKMKNRAVMGKKSERERERDREEEAAGKRELTGESRRDGGGSKGS